jgi:hypothetical protein
MPRYTAVLDQPVIRQNSWSEVPSEEPHPMRAGKPHGSSRGRTGHGHAGIALTQQDAMIRSGHQLSTARPLRSQPLSLRYQHGRVDLNRAGSGVGRPECP